MTRPGDPAPIGHEVDPAIAAKKRVPSILPPWTESGYPVRHADAVRSAYRSACIAILVTGVPFLVLFLGTLWGDLPALLTAVSGALFLMIGLVGGIGAIRDTHRHIRVIPYFRRRLGEIDTFLAGRSMARYLQHLDAIASEQSVAGLSTFGFADDLRGEQVQWHDPRDGLRSIEAILKGLEQTDLTEPIRTPLLDDLGKWRQALQRAVAEDVPFAILLRHGDVTSGHEWDVRAGSAF